MTVSAGAHIFQASLDESTRKSLLEGRWDPIADLLEAGPLLDERESQLPYL